MENSYQNYLKLKNSNNQSQIFSNPNQAQIDNRESRPLLSKENNPSKNPRSKSSGANKWKNKNNALTLQKAQENIQTINFQFINQETIDISYEFHVPSNILSILKEFQGRYNRDTRSWEIPYRNYSDVYHQIYNCNLPNTILCPLTLLPINFLCQPPKLTQLKFYLEKKTEFIIDYSKDIVHSILELPPNLLASLYKFQREGIEFGIKKNGRLLLADEMGVGKTIQGISISAIFKEDWPVLILCPSSLKFAWRDEISNWLSDIIDSKEVQIFKKSSDEFKEKAKYYIMSYDISIRILDKIKEKKFNFIIADEAHYLKNKESKRSMNLIPLFQQCKRLILLTGTPILAKPVEAYPLLNALRPDLFHNFKEFGTRYCNPQKRIYGIDWSGSSNSRELHYLLSKVMIRRLKKNVLAELPPKKRQKIEIISDSKTLLQIRVLMKKHKTNIDLENETITKDLIKLDENEEQENDPSSELSCFTKAYMLTGKAKIPGIKDYINYLIDNSCKFLVFAHHLNVLDAIEEEVKKSKIGYIRIDGNIALEKRYERVNQYQTDDNCYVAILAITACATGLTLTKASTVVFAELHFTPAIMIQAEDRAHRIGQEHQCVNVHYLYAKDTVDEVVFNKLTQKHFVVSSTLDNRAVDMGVQKIKEKIGDFEKAKVEFSTQRDKNLVLIDSGMNKTLDQFIKKSNDKYKDKDDDNKKDDEINVDLFDINIHPSPSKRMRPFNLDNKTMENDANDNDYNYKKTTTFFINNSCLNEI